MKCDKCKKNKGTHDIRRRTERLYPPNKKTGLQSVATYFKQVKLCDKCYAEVSK